MLTEDQKDEIQAAYLQLIEQRGFHLRQCQKQMIAEVARTLAGTASPHESELPVSIIEAGTGTGKTLAYLIPAISLARSLNRKLVVSTATVALQEQIMFRDLPDLARHSGLAFSSALAKGRRRYICLANLDRVFRGQARLGLNDGPAETLSVSDIELYEAMSRSLGEGHWDGEFDSWPAAVDATTRTRLSTDYSQCLGRRCSAYRECVFFRARKQVGQADVIVANHDLVLADLMAGASVLPDPEDCFFIFDEAHHLPGKATQHLSHSLPLNSTRDWLVQMPDVVEELLSDVDPAIEVKTRPLLVAVTNAARACGDLLERCSALLDGLPSVKSRQFRFRYGRLDEGLRSLAQALEEVSRKLSGNLEQAHGLAEDALETVDELDRQPLEAVCLQLKHLHARADNARGLWAAYSRQDVDEAPPLARWTSRGEKNGDLTLHASPVMVADDLDTLIWQRCSAAVLTSATLSVAGDFTRFREQVGLPETAGCISLASPFHFQEKAVLSVPPMDCDPGDQEAHCRKLVELLPQLVSPGLGNLVIFTAWQQLRAVQAGLSQEFLETLLCQQEMSKQELLRHHRERVDKGLTSVIFGVASFAEGIDLPGNYCAHVIITRLPFTVPDDPVFATLCEWFDSQHRNAFNQISLPDATLRLVQASGRLLRTEEDSGRITVLDRRLVTRSYGRRMLAALPPYRRQ